MTPAALSLHEAIPYPEKISFMVCANPVLNIPARLVADVEALALRDYPRETCGFLVGRWDGGAARVTHVLPTGNRHFSNPNHFYQIDAATYLHAEEITQKAGLILLGVFHSHPDAPPDPSVTDSKYAFPGWIYWIAPVFKERPDPPAAWLRSDDAESWTRMTIQIE